MHFLIFIILVTHLSLVGGIAGDVVAEEVSCLMGPLVATVVVVTEVKVVVMVGGSTMGEATL